MRPNNLKLMDDLSAAEDQSSSPVPTANVLYISAQAVVTGTSTGTLKLQYSNDNVFPPNAPANLSDIPNATVSIAGAGVYSIPKTDLCYTYVKAVFTATNAESGTITVNAKTIGA